MENVFPTPVGFFNFEEGLSEENIKFLKEQKQRPNEGNTSSDDRYLLKHECLSALNTFIENSIHEYFTATFNPKHNVKLRITQSWLNFSNPGQWHHQHAHPCSLISGCFYVNAVKETDKIYFHKNYYDPMKFPPKEWNIYNSESWWFSVGTGDLVLFPSSLAHRVAPVEGTETRISLAFNTFPVGYVGDEDNLTALHL